VALRVVDNLDVAKACYQIVPSYATEPATPYGGLTFLTITHHEQMQNEFARGFDKCSKAWTTHRSGLLADAQLRTGLSAHLVAR